MLVDRYNLTDWDSLVLEVPFGLPNTPGCPKIKATGIFCSNDLENLEFIIEDGKITSFRAIAFGEKTGPPGFYNQVAGLVF
jgi:hypothetical protein